MEFQLAATESGERYHLAQTMSLVGRDPRVCNVCISLPGISKVHCLIEVRNNHVLIQDQGSLNGTIVDGERVEQAELRAGDCFSLGRREFRIEQIPARPVYDDVELIEDDVSPLDEDSPVESAGLPDDVVPFEDDIVPTNDPPAFTSNKPDTADDWYCQIFTEVFGPLSFAELRQLSEYADLSADDKVRRGANGAWVPAATIPGLLPTSESDRPANARSGSPQQDHTGLESALADKRTDDGFSPVSETMSEANPARPKPAERPKKTGQPRRAPQPPLRADGNGDDYQSEAFFAGESPAQPDSTSRSGRQPAEEFDDDLENDEMIWDFPP